MTKAKKYKTVLTAAALALASSLPLFSPTNYYITLFTQCLINMVVVLGLNFIMGMTGQPNFGSAGIYAIGAYIAALLITKLSVNPWLALLAAIAAGVLVGYGLGYPSLRLKGVYLSITTIAFAESVRHLLKNLTPITNGVNGVRGIPRYQLFGIPVAGRYGFYYFMLAVVLILGFVAYRIIHSKWGRAFFAIRDNIDAMESCGLNVASIKITAFVLSAVFGAIGGALYAHFVGYVNPVMFTTDTSINFVIMLVAGGAGTLPGCIIGTILITLLPEYLRFLGEYYQLFYYGILLVFVILVPGGIMSLLKRRN